MFAAHSFEGDAGAEEGDVLGVEEGEGVEAILEDGF